MNRAKRIFGCSRGMCIFALTVAIIVVYGAALYFLRSKGILQPESFVENMTAFIGWLVALLIALIHLRKKRADSLILNKQETKKRLEIEAFRELNNAVSTFSNTIG